MEEGRRPMRFTNVSHYLSLIPERDIWKNLVTETEARNSKDIYSPRSTDNFKAYSILIAMITNSRDTVPNVAGKCYKQLNKVFNMHAIKDSNANEILYVGPSIMFLAGIQQKDLAKIQQEADKRVWKHFDYVLRCLKFDDKSYFGLSFSYILLYLKDCPYLENAQYEFKQQQQNQ